MRITGQFASSEGNSWIAKPKLEELPIIFMGIYEVLWELWHYRYTSKNLKKKKCQVSIVCIKLSENGSPVKLHHISDIPNFPSDSDIEN